MVIMMFNNVELSLLVNTLLKPVIVLQAGFGLGQCCTLLSTIMSFLPTLSVSVIYIGLRKVETRINKVLN